MFSSSDIKVDSNGRCSLAFKNLREIPYTTIGRIAPRIIELDLSHNNLSDLPRLDYFANLQSLVIDHNRIQSNFNFNAKQPLPRLNLLWANSNKIKNLPTFIEKIKECCPNLRILSMLNNEACPNYFNGGTPEQYEDYRLFVISRLPNLNTLDSTPVTQQEKDQAKEKYGDLSIQPILKLKEEKRLQKKQEQEKIKKVEQQQRQIEKDNVLTHSSSKQNLTVPKNILPDVKDLVSTPPQPLTQKVSTASFSSDDVDDTEQDANDDTFESTLDSVVDDETSHSPNVKRVAITATPFLLAEQRSAQKSQLSLPDPSSLTNKPIAVLQEALRTGLTLPEPDETDVQTNSSKRRKS